MELNWEAVSAIGQVVGAVGVIISLVYVGLQIRADRRQRRAMTMHEQSQAYADILDALATNGELADIYIRGIQDMASLNGVERVRFIFTFSSIFRIYEDSYFQHREGHLDQRIWRGLEAPIGDLLAYSGVREWWRTREHHFSPEFRSIVDAKIAEHRDPKIYEKEDAQVVTSTATDASVSY